MPPSPSFSDQTGSESSKSDRPTRTRDLALLRSVVLAVCRDLGAPVTLKLLAARAGIPASSLARSFRRLTGETTLAWVWRLRVLTAVALMERLPERRLSEVAARCGFGSAAHFSRKMREITGWSPSGLRREIRRGRLRLAMVRHEGRGALTPAGPHPDPVTTALHQATARWPWHADGTATLAGTSPPGDFPIPSTTPGPVAYHDPLSASGGKDEPARPAVENADAQGAPSG